MSERTDSLITQFLERVSQYQSEWGKGTKYPWKPWFRGEPYCRSATALLPKLYRSKKKRKRLRYEEQELRAEFQRHAVALMSGLQPKGKLAHWEWYFLMQHHGVPTRLLDWTDASLVGLYFALSSRKAEDDDDSADAAVCMLDPYWLNDLSFKEMRLGKGRPVGIAFPDWPEMAEYLRKDPFDLDRLKPALPLAITPSHLSARIAAQKSQFTIFGHDRGDFLVKQANEKASRIRVIPIAGKRKQILQLRAELAGCGISESSVYPDLDGLGREFYMEWKARCRQIAPRQKSI